MQQKVIRSGLTSLAVIIPARFVHALGVKAGDVVKVGTNDEKGQVLIKFSGAQQLHLPGADNKKIRHK